MPSFTASALFAASLIASASASAVFNPSAKTNVVTYWGQGPNQKKLVETCKNEAIDVVNIGFVNQFPDNTGNDYPGTNFGNACYGDVYTLPNGQNSSLLKTCPNIGPDVITCQQTYGKKIFLSIGGGYPTNYYLKNDTTARTFADFLWKAWGPVQSAYTGPRPWGNASVDGFDFDIESYTSPAPAGNTNYQTSGYAAAINHLHNDLYPTDTTKSYYISGAPQCVLPDSHLSSILSSAWFDFMFIQFYNTPQCSARAGLQHTQGKSTNDITFHNWAQSKSLNSNVRYYIGLPAATGAASDASFYLTPDEAQQTVNRFYTNESLFGGIMTWEATYSQNNVICRKEYSTWMKDILLGAASGHPLNTTTAACDSSPPLTESPDGSCGGATGYTCSPGNCCSKYGYCGATSDYCSAGCDPTAGICWATTSSSTSAAKTSTTSTTSRVSSSTTTTPTTLKVTTTTKPTTTSTSLKTTTSSKPITTSKTTSTTAKSTTTSKATVKAALVQATTKKTSTTTTKKPTSTTKKPTSTKKSTTSTKRVTTTIKIR